MDKMATRPLVSCETCKHEGDEKFCDTKCIVSLYSEWEPKQQYVTICGSYNPNVIPVKLMNTDDPDFIPNRKHANDAGADLRARIDHELTLFPLELLKIPTGIGAEIPQKHVGLVIARSGATTDGKVTLIGAVDSGYRGEIGMNVVNLTKDFITIVPKERLAQLIVVPCMIADFILTDKLSESERGENGFGSTGVV